LTSYQGAAPFKDNGRLVGNVFTSFEESATLITMTALTIFDDVLISLDASSSQS
jgi:hypothetical protein